MLLDHYYWSLDGDTLRKYLPIAVETMAFFRQHYPIRDGKVSIFPSQALETFWCDAADESPAGARWSNGSWDGDAWNRTSCVENDAPTLAALHTLSEKLLQLPDEFTTANQRQAWKEYAAALPPLPVRDSTLMAYGNTESFPPKGHNGETPQLYSVHPYRRFTVGRAHASGVDLAPAKNAARSGQPGWGFGSNAGWNQDIMNNALLGRVSRDHCWHLG